MNVMYTSEPGATKYLQYLQTGTDVVSLQG
jgi:hypothetical protein